MGVAKLPSGVGLWLLTAYCMSVGFVLSGCASLLALHILEIPASNFQEASELMACNHQGDYEWLGIGLSVRSDRVTCHDICIQLDSGTKRPV